MQLDEFVKNSLVQIAKGVSDAGKKVFELGGSVNPQDNAIVGGSKVPIDVQPSNIDFDVAVIVTDSGSSEAGGQLKIASLVSFGGKMENAESYQQTSRIKFSIPMRLPKDNQNT